MAQLTKHIGENGAVVELELPATGAYAIAIKDGRLTPVEPAKRKAGRPKKDDSAADD